MAPLIAQVPASVDLPRVTKRTQLKSSGNLDQFEKFDATPVIGTEFAPEVQLSDFLSAPNSDELIHDLAILGMSSQWNTAYFSVATKRCVFPRSKYHRKTTGGTCDEARRTLG
jgi:hypothetical protein